MRVHESWLAVLSDPVRLDLLRCLCEMEAVTPGELAPKVHASERTVRRHLEILAAIGMAEERKGASDGETPGRPAANFALTATARQGVRALFELLSQPLGSPAHPPSSVPPLGR